MSIRSGPVHGTSWGNAMSEMLGAGDVGTHCVTVKEVMAIYRIGRCAAYEQAALYLRHGPGHGIPCLRLGRSLRFPIAWIEGHIGRRITLDVSTTDDDALDIGSTGDRQAPPTRGLTTVTNQRAKVCDETAVTTR
jgi:hypothetical protein